MAKKEKTKKSKHKYLKKGLLVSAFVVLIIFGAFFCVRYFQVNKKYTELSMTQDQRNQQTINKVSKLMDLPKNEKPTIFEVKEKAKLGNAKVTVAYFQNAQNGDVILAYDKANLSIIYRPGEKRIIKTDNYTNFYAAANPVKIAIIAPTSQQQDTENLVYSKVINAEVVSKQVPKNGVALSCVADTTGQNAKAAKELADKINLSVCQLPEGETKPSNALLVVLISTPTNSAPSP